MKSDMKAGVFAVAVASLAFLFTFGGSYIVRADDSETLSYPEQNMGSVPITKTTQALEQRLAYLEERVAALTESLQHINTHRLCVSDDSGAETCVTKAQLDALLIGQAHVEEISHPSAIVGDVTTIPSAEPVAIASTTDNGEVPASAISNEASQNEQEPEHTGAITAIVPATELNMTPDSEIPDADDLR